MLLFLVSPSSADVDTDNNIGQCDVATRSGDIETIACFRELPFICKVAAKDAPYDQHCGVYGNSKCQAVAMFYFIFVCESHSLIKGK